MKKAIAALLLVMLTCAGIYLLAPESARSAADAILSGRFASCGKKGTVSQAGRLVYDADNVPAAADGRPVIVLDPGHGGRDPGAVNKKLGMVEADINLEIARELALRLDASGKFAVYLTHDGLGPTEKMDLQQRVECAVALRAGLFISLHNNSEDPDSSGAEIYVSGRKNEASEGAYMLAEQMMYGFGEHGMRLRGIYSRMSEEANTDPQGRLYDYYGVIRMSSDHGIPAMLVEHGFLNEHDAPFILTPEGVENIVDSEYRAIMRWYGFEPCEVPVPGSGDGDSDGMIDRSDVELALSAAMCAVDSPTGGSYAALDINGDRRIDSADISHIYMFSRGVACAREYRRDPPRHGILSDADGIKKGGKVTFTVSFSQNGELLSAAGILGYDKRSFRLDSTSCEGRNILFDEDRDFGLVRWCLYPDDALAAIDSSPDDVSTAEIEFVMTVLDDSSPTGLSVNSALYSASYYDSRAGCIITYGRDIRSVFMTTPKQK